MKLVKRKTKKAIQKAVRKAMKKHGPALLAGLASSLAASIATLAKTEAPGRRGKSNLASMVEDAKETLTDSGDEKSPQPGPEKRIRRMSDDTEPTPRSVS